MERMCDSSRSGRLVVSLQIVSWCAVGVVLLLRGATTLRNEPSTATISNCSSESNETSYGIIDNEECSNSSTTVQKLRKTMNVHINPSSAILITVGTTMLVIGPILLLARLIDHRRQHQASTGFTKVDAPPSYEEVTEKAPRYSALFEVTDTGEWVPIPPVSTLHSEPA